MDVCSRTPLEEGKLQKLKPRRMLLEWNDIGENSSDHSLNVNDVIHFNEGSILIEGLYVNNNVNDGSGLNEGNVNDNANDGSGMNEGNVNNNVNDGSGMNEGNVNDNFNNGSCMNEVNVNDRLYVYGWGFDYLHFSQLFPNVNEGGDDNVGGYGNEHLEYDGDKEHNEISDETSDSEDTDYVVDIDKEHNDVGVDIRDFQDNVDP
ncbi:hypothetical protein QVD17_17231 [Tagetes erecta]|uniref:Uncharacterized protein n=1 Tax=Tagetes erecta TaxID=13708 RepID=A0AAD8KSU4_TARER|nr:hypothetical protein QVD17_17231 [Tagetes erecta]